MKPPTHRLALLLAFALVFALSGCQKEAEPSSPSPAPEPESSSQAAPVQDESPPEEESPPETPELPTAVHMEQWALSFAGGYLVWEADITDPEELALMAELFSVKELPTQPKSPIPDGGTTVKFTFRYNDRTEDYHCNPLYATPRPVESEDWIPLVFDGVEYRYPKETALELLEFMESKNISITG